MAFSFEKYWGKYWAGESQWSKEILPQEIERICKDPLADRILILGPIGIGKTRLAQSIALFKAYIRSSDAYRVYLDEQMKGGLKAEAIPKYAEKNIPRTVVKKTEDQEEKQKDN